MRNDGRGNLLGALLIAGQFVIPEVTKRKMSHTQTLTHAIPALYLEKKREKLRVDVFACGRARHK